MPALVLIVPAPVIVIPLLEFKAKPLEVFKVPPLKIILSTSADPGVEPRLASLATSKVPPEIVVLPSKCLFQIGQEFRLSLVMECRPSPMAAEIVSWVPSTSTVSKCHPPAKLEVWMHTGPISW